MLGSRTGRGGFGRLVYELDGQLAGVSDSIGNQEVRTCVRVGQVRLLTSSLPCPISSSCLARASFVTTFGTIIHK
jgi:hypothetical protein